MDTDDDGRQIRTVIRLIVLLYLVLFIGSCSDECTGPDQHEQSTIPTERVSGTVELPAGSNVGAEDLKVVSFSSSTKVDSTGQFSLSSPVAETYQVLFVVSAATQEAVLLGLRDPVEGTVAVNDTSTALSLMLFNPYLVYANQSQRGEYLTAVRENPSFPGLLAALRQAYASDAEKALDYGENAEVYQLAAQIMKEAMESLAVKAVFERPAGIASEPLTIEDAPGANITFVNPRHVWYAAGIYPGEGPLREIVTINRQETLVTFQWGWPPAVDTDPARTDHRLGDGYFKILAAKGLDFTKILEWDDPIGRGTLYNTGQGILYIVELVVGFAPTPNFATLPNHFRISSGRAAALSLDIAQNDTGSFLVNLAELLAENSEAIALWIWEETGNTNAHVWLTKAAGITQNVALVLKILGFVNEQGPFFWDLIFVEPSVTYFVTQTGGTITSIDSGDIDDMVFVPAGYVLMGKEGVAEPVHTVFVDAFYIDRYEVTTAQYQTFIAEGGYDDPGYWNPIGWEWRTSENITQPDGWMGEVTYLHNNPQLYPSFPVQGVSWWEADAYCRWAGKRLPTEAEWEKAAKGGCEKWGSAAECDARDTPSYPWGEAIDGSRANFYGSGDPYFNKGGTTPVGYYDGSLREGFQTTDSPSPYGLYDVAGNVSEWCSTEFAPYPYDEEDGRENPPESANDCCRVWRGASFPYHAVALRSANRCCPHSEASTRHSVVGFRCVMDP